MDEEPARCDLLLVGDVHLGRRPTGLDAVLRDCGVERDGLTPAAALELAVDEALARRPRAVVFAGDVVDQDRDRFEAYPHLERAVRRLVEAGIGVLGVAGNHDGVALPRLAARVPEFRLLGSGGTWERAEVPGDGPPIDLIAWSFPARRHTGCPLDAPGLPEALGSARADAAVIGVLHGDLDASSSPYAPVSRRALEDRDSVAAWFLGHVHRPGDLSGPRPVGYLGSLVGLDAGEPGRRGPWCVRVEGGAVRAEHVPLAPLRYEHVDVPLEDDDGGVDEDAVAAAIDGAVREHVRKDASLTDPRVRLVVVRARLRGRLRDTGPATARAAAHRAEEGVLDVDGRTVVIERVSSAVRAALDVDALAAEPSPIGHVARVLVALRDDHDDAGDVTARAGRAVREVEDGYAADREHHPAADVRDIVERAAWRVLETLHAQRERGAD